MNGTQACSPPVNSRHLNPSWQSGDSGSQTSRHKPTAASDVPKTQASPSVQPPYWDQHASPIATVPAATQAPTSEKPDRRAHCWFPGQSFAVVVQLGRHTGSWSNVLTHANPLRHAVLPVAHASSTSSEAGTHNSWPSNMRHRNWLGHCVASASGSLHMGKQNVSPFDASTHNPEPLQSSPPNSHPKAVQKSPVTLSVQDIPSGQGFVKLQDSPSLSGVTRMPISVCGEVSAHAWKTQGMRSRNLSFMVQNPIMSARAAKSGPSISTASLSDESI